MSREGLIVQHGANRYLVEDETTRQGLPGTGEVLACTLRGRLRRGRQHEVRLAVIGDRVRFEPLEGESEPQGVIEEVLPRRNKVSRPAPSGSFRRPLEQIVIANLDRLWVTASLAQPPFNVRFIDRILAASRFQEVEAGVILNKVDLPDAVEAEPSRELYERLGYPVRICSAVTGAGLEDLRHDLQNRITAFVGLSGVGKSSLLTAIQPGLDLRVASVGEKSGHGRHTTSGSRLYPLDLGGYVADTPGMREFGLWGMLRADLAAGFVEIEALAPDCRFRDCMHLEEPGCAVREAEASGQVDGGRYLSYRALLDELPQDGLERDGIVRGPRR